MCPARPAIGTATGTRAKCQSMPLPPHARMRPSHSDEAKPTAPGETAPGPAGQMGRGMIAPLPLRPLPTEGAIAHAAGEPTARRPPPASEHPHPRYISPSRLCARRSTRESATTLRRPASLPHTSGAGARQHTLARASLRVRSCAHARMHGASERVHIRRGHYTALRTRHRRAARGAPTQPRRRPRRAAAPTAPPPPQVPHRPAPPPPPPPPPCGCPCVGGVQPSTTRRTPRRREQRAGR